MVVRTVDIKWLLAKEKNVAIMHYAWNVCGESSQTACSF